ncbi:MAG: hypothetical protein C0424_12030 [Sphingobacteriaceae bacterium]|nr:hypothetical protein [Sphingobacteriaceae bacterium]
MALIISLACMRSVSAQFIRMTINLPPGFEAKPDPSFPQVLEAPVDGSTNFARQGIRWIEFRSRENVQLSIQARFEPRPGAMATMYYLNNNTTDFNAAKILPPFKSTVTIYDGPRLMRDFPEDVVYLSAWLGLPAERGGLLTIEFH